MKNTKWKKNATAALALFLVLSCAAAAYASGDGAIPREKWMDLLYRAMNFAGLAFILVFFLKKPFSDGLSSRRAGIKDQLEALESRKAEAEQLYKEAEAKLARLDEEVNSIITEAVKQGEAEKAKIVADAERNAGDIKRQAEMAIAHELAEAKTRLKGEIAEQAVLLAEELVKKNIQPADQSRMVELSLEKVGGIQ
ncbi:ATP synthase F0 subunit B [Thiovibrio frasassiensis]|uniref:ATP synthase subunit b n=1 Tax=Thiovibrio frasassiensis TaxID=2984131 RepID=A0A9X4MEA7_9BACT|nr:ATP synthase F0 subunit B [Thiovibrio frasassiensis]MDG4475696.1 ATP synthase F0 subunit B [Thiovibrio frasassiensis]